MIASASRNPFGPAHSDGRWCRVEEENDAYIFPGIEVGTVASRSSTISEPTPRCYFLSIPG
jgi:malic enzyme